MTFLLAIALASTTFGAMGHMPSSTVYDRSGCTGSNRSPELHWRAAPRGTRSFAIVMFDPDATGGWYHWIAYNIPAATLRLAEGAALPASELGTTSWGESPYGGPCPPPGKPHRYVTTIYALDVARLPAAHMTGPQLQTAIAGHVLARASLTAFFGR